MYCKKCGAKLDKGASYCVSCLTRVPKSDSASVGTENSAKDNTTENSTQNNMMIIIAGVAIGMVLLYFLK